MPKSVNWALVVIRKSLPWKRICIITIATLSKSPEPVLFTISLMLRKVTLLRISSVKSLGMSIFSVPSVINSFEVLIVGIFHRTFGPFSILLLPPLFVGVLVISSVE